MGHKFIVFSLQSHKNVGDALVPGPHPLAFLERTGPPDPPEGNKSDRLCDVSAAQKIAPCHTSPPPKRIEPQLYNLAHAHQRHALTHIPFFPTILIFRVSSECVDADCWNHSISPHTHHHHTQHPHPPPTAPGTRLL